MAQELKIRYNKSIHCLFTMHGCEILELLVELIVYNFKLWSISSQVQEFLFKGWQKAQSIT